MPSIQRRPGTRDGFKEGDTVQVDRCDQWPHMVGQHGVVHFISDETDDPNMTVLFDNVGFPGIVSRRSDFSKVE